MTDKEKYLKGLKKELNTYTKQLLIIQEDFKGKTGENIEKINQSLQDILDEAVIAYGKLKSASAEEWEPVKTLTNEAFDNLKNSIHERINTSTNQLKEYAEQIETSFEKQMESVEKYVKKHPFKSLFMAAGAGFILGRILK